MKTVLAGLLSVALLMALLVSNVTGFTVYNTAGVTNLSERINELTQDNQDLKVSLANAEQTILSLNDSLTQTKADLATVSDKNSELSDELSATKANVTNASSTSTNQTSSLALEGVFLNGDNATTNSTFLIPVAFTTSADAKSVNVLLTIYDSNYAVTNVGSAFNLDNVTYVSGLGYEVKVPYNVSANAVTGTYAIMQLKLRDNLGNEETYGVNDFGTIPKFQVN